MGTLPTTCGECPYCVSSVGVPTGNRCFICRADEERSTIAYVEDISQITRKPSWCPVDRAANLLSSLER